MEKIKNRLLALLLCLTMLLSMLPATAVAAEPDGDASVEVTADIEHLDEEQGPVEAITPAGSLDEDGSRSETGLVDSSPETDVEPEDEEASEIIEAPVVDAEAEADLPEVELMSIQQDVPNAGVAMNYLSQFAGTYRISRDIAAKDWSIEVSDSGDVTLLQNGQDTGATVTALTWNATTSVVTNLTFTLNGWYKANTGDAAATLVFGWNVNGYFTMPNTTIYRGTAGSRTSLAFTNGAILYNETALESYFAAYAGEYRLNDGSGWYVEISGEGKVSLHDGDDDSATAGAVISSVTWNTTNHSLVSTVVFMNPDWYNSAATPVGSQTLTLTWTTPLAWNSESCARNEFSTSNTTLYTSVGSGAAPWKVFTTSHIFVGENWANDYFEDYTGAYPAGAGNADTKDWQLVIDEDGYVRLYEGETALNEAPARLTAVTGTNGVARVSTMTVAIPNWYVNTSYNTPGIITLTWQADSASGSGIGRFTTAAVTLHRRGSDGQDETLYLPALYFDHETRYTAKAKALLTDYAGTYTLDDGSGWYAEIADDGGVTLCDADGKTYAPYYYNLTNPLGETPTLTSILFRDAEWYNNAATSAAYQTLTLVWSATISTASTYARPAFIGTASNGAALTTVFYNADKTVLKNFNGARFTSTSWANDYFKGGSEDQVDYTGTYDVGAGYGQQYPQVAGWKLDIDDTGAVWLKDAQGSVCSAPATLTAVASTNRTTTSTAILRVSTMVVAVPGYYANFTTKQPAYLTLTWSADTANGTAWQGNGLYRFTTAAANLYNAEGEAVYFPAMYFDHSGKYTAAAKGLLKGQAGTYKINDGSGWFVTVDETGAVTLTDEAGVDHAPYYYSVSGLLGDSPTLSSVTFGDCRWLTAAAAPQTVTLNWSAATQRFTPSGTVTLYDDQGAVRRSFSASTIFSKTDNLDKAGNYLKQFAGVYPFNDGTESALRINDDGTLAIKLSGITQGDDFVSVDYTPTFSNYTYAGNEGGDYVSSVQLPIPGWYANASVNTPAFLTLTWYGNLATIANHYFTNSSTAFYKTAEDYQVLSAGRFYAQSDMDKAAAWLQAYAGVYHPRVSDAWYATIGEDGYVTIHTKDAAGGDLSIAPALNIAVNATGEVTGVSTVYAVLPAYAANRDNRDAVYVNAAPQVSLTFAVSRASGANGSIAYSAYFAPGYNANSGLTLYSRTDEDGAPWQVTNSTTYKTVAAKLYTADRAYSDANKERAADYFKGYAGTYVIDDGASSYKLMVTDAGQLFWSDSAVESTDGLLPADVAFNTVLNGEAVPYTVYVWHNGYYGAATAAQAGEYNNYTFTHRSEMVWNTAGANAAQQLIRYSFTGGTTTAYTQDGTSRALANKYHYFTANALPDHDTYPDGRYDNADSSHWIDIISSDSGRTYLFDSKYPLTLYGKDDNSAYLRGNLGDGSVFGVFPRDYEVGFTVSAAATYTDTDGASVTIPSDAVFTLMTGDGDGSFLVVDPGQSQETGTRYDYLTQAVFNVKDGGTIYLTDDVAIRVMAEATGSKTFTIDGQGHTMTRGQVNGVAYTGTFLKIDNGCAVTLTDVKIDGGGNWTLDEDVMAKNIELAKKGISSTSQTALESGGGYALVDHGGIDATDFLFELGGGTSAITLSEGVEITNFYGTASSTSHIISLTSGASGGSITLDGAKIYHNACYSYLLSYNTNKTSITVTGDTELYDNYSKGAHAVLFHVNGGSDLTIQDDVKIYDNVAIYSAGIVAAVTSAGTTVHIEGGEIYDNIGLGNAGAVFWVNSSSRFYMSGGHIHHNTGNTTGVLWQDLTSYGRGNGEGYAEFSGGVIEHNTALSNSWNKGMEIFAGAIIEGSTVDANISVFEGGMTLGGTIEGNVRLSARGTYKGTNHFTIEESGTVTGNVTVSKLAAADNVCENNGTIEGNLTAADGTHTTNNGTIGGDVNITSSGVPSGESAFVNGTQGTVGGDLNIAAGASAANEGTIQGNVTIASDGSAAGSTAFVNGADAVVEGSLEIGPGAIASNEGAVKGNVDVKADGEFVMEGGATVDGDVTIMPGGELRSNSDQGAPHINGKVTLEYENEEDLRRMQEILEDSGITYEDIAYVLHEHTSPQSGGTPATCLEPGVSYEECGTCQRRYNMVELAPTGHTLGDPELYQALSCTTDEIYIQTCQNEGCDFQQSETTAKATGHNFAEDPSDYLAPTATEAGSRRFECQNGCDTYYTVEVPALGSCEEHVWDQGRVSKAPGCEEDGEMIYQCIQCHAEMKTPIAQTGHTSTGQAVMDPASFVERKCNVNGSYDMVEYCANCGQEMAGTRTTYSIPANGHSWGEWSFVGEDGGTHICTAEGRRQHTCLICGQTESEVVRATAHTWDAGVVNATAHTTTYTCLVCPATKTVARDDRPSDMVIAALQEAIAQGRADLELVKEGTDANNFAPTQLWAPADDIETYRDILDTTEEELGTEGLTQAQAEELLEALQAARTAFMGTEETEGAVKKGTNTDIVIPATQVAFVDVDGEAIPDKTVTVEVGKSVTVKVTVEPIDATGVYVNDQDTDVYTMNVSEDINLHPSDIVITGAKAGSARLSVCYRDRAAWTGERYAVQDDLTVIVVAGHVWSEGEVTRAPSCTVEGERIYTCSLCGETRTEAISTVDHTWVDVAAQDATCTQDGFSAHQKCIFCGLERDKTEITAPGHNFQDGVCTVCGQDDPDYIPTPPTPDEPGCSCGEGCTCEEDCGCEAGSCQCPDCPNKTPAAPGPNRPSSGIHQKPGGTAQKSEDEICPKDDTCPLTQFADLDVNSWYHDGVQYCLEKNLMKGTSDTMFEPLTPIGRAMITTILWRLEGEPQARIKIADFTDVDSDSWYIQAVRWAAEQEIVIGYGDGRFCPDAAITREQMAAMLYRYAKATKAEGSLTAFVDGASVSDWATDAMTWAVSQGIITGKDGQRLDPQGKTTRAETAVMFQRFLELVK